MGVRALNSHNPHTGGLGGCHAGYRVFHDDTLRGRLLEAGEERTSCFTWDETARKTLALYKRLAEGK